jgi:cell division protein FtsI (penicillin-binding protein 3)
MNRFREPGGVWMRRRLILLCFGLAMGFGAVMTSAYKLMVEDGPAWRELAETQRERRLRVRPKRGTILDRNGSALAVSVEVPTVTLDAVELLRNVPSEDVPRVAREAAEPIAMGLGLEPAFVERKILARRRWTWLKRHVTPAEVEAMRRIGEPTHVPRIRGVLVEGEPLRQYPRRELLGPVLGFVSPDGEGKDGLELSQNGELAGHPEQLRGLRDRAGKLIFDRGTDDARAFAGHNVYLTIDQALQYSAERELGNAVNTFEAIGGSVVVLDPLTGEILAMASAPGFNPNDYRQSEPSARKNRAVGEVFEPGSTMKIFTVAAALDKNVIQPTEQLYCENGVFRVDNVTIRDTHPAEWLPVSQVLAQSSNICAAKIGLTLGPEGLYDALRRFGFGERTDLGLTGELPGTLRPQSRSWVQVETASAAFGQGISVTNLQLALATAAIANGGELLTPQLLHRVETATGELVRASSRHVRRRVVSERVARQLAEMLVAVTEDGGTGVEAALPGHLVAGKTATAQKADPSSGRYSLDDYIASFVGFVPAHKPRLVIAVTLDSPRADHSGGNVAAPVFREVAKTGLNLLGEVPDRVAEQNLRDLSRAPDRAQAAHAIFARARGELPHVQEVVERGKVGPGQVRIPDLTGVPMRSALRDMADLGLAVDIRGSGLLVEQRPVPGSVVDKGARVELNFRPRT